MNSATSQTANFGSLPDEAFINVKAVALIFGCCTNTVWRYVRLKKIPEPIRFSEQNTKWNVGELRKALKKIAGEKTPAKFSPAKAKKQEEQSLPAPKFTRTTWYPAGFDVEVTQENTADICTCDPSNFGQHRLNRPVDEILANVLLISQAPKMYALLKDIALGKEVTDEMREEAFVILKNATTVAGETA